PAEAVATPRSPAMKPSRGWDQYTLPMATPAATANSSVSHPLISDGASTRGALTPTRPATFNLYPRGGLAARAGSCSRMSGRSRSLLNSGIHVEWGDHDRRDHCRGRADRPDAGV